MTLDKIRTLYEEMLAADQAYKKADPLEVHHAYSALMSARFRYSRACGEYVAELLEVDDE